MQEVTGVEARNKVWEMIKDIRIAQMVTHVGEDDLCARPMAAMNRDFDGVLWFYTDASSPKNQEIEKNGKVLLSYSDPANQDYISVQGNASISNDRAKIEQLWAEPARIYFPQGKEDPAIRFIRVEVTRAEYWDSSSSDLVMIYSYVVARMTGEKPNMGENKKVKFA